MDANFLVYFRSMKASFFALVAVPAAPVRRKPLHSQEMVNQLLFGEAVKILKERGERWVKVRSLHDKYEGWITRNMLQPCERITAETRFPMVVTEMLGKLTIGDSVMYIPAGSVLPGYTDGKGWLGESVYSYNGFCRDRDGETASSELVQQLALAWLNAPYLWGGRTPLGVDCSGFVQVIYKMMGIDLPRDAWQQAQAGSPVKKLEEARTGDLAFFDQKEEIVHTGILLGNDRIIHASGQVRIDGMSSKGIIHAGTGKRTARLRAIRRVW